MNNEEEYNVDKEIDEDNYSLKDRIGCILFIIWFIGSIFIMISSKKYSMIAFGQFFLVFGILSYKSKDVKIKLEPLLFILIGVGIIVVSILHLLKVNLNWKLLIPVLLFIGMIMTGIVFVLTTVVDIFRLKKECTVLVKATIVKYCYMYSMDGYTRRKIYSPIYRFNYNNKYYETFFPYFNNFSRLKSINSVEEIRINPNNPNEIFIVDITPKFMIILGIIITIVFLIAFIYYCFFVI